MKWFSVLVLISVIVVSADAGTFSEMEKLASAKTGAKPRVALSDDPTLKSIVNADIFESGNVPNYIRVMAQNTKAAKQFADLIQTFVFGGTIKPETKMAMVLTIAGSTESAYTFAQAKRWLTASESGRKWLTVLRDNNLASLSPADQTAIRYARLLTMDVHGITDKEFLTVRDFYNDSQIVEMTMVVCLFNHFARLVEATNLPVEAFTLSDTPATPVRFSKYTGPTARIALISDSEMAGTQKIMEAAKTPQTPQQGLGLGIANSQRAMLRVPDLAAAWREFGAQRQSWSIDRAIQLQISFAVSMANGCRYCTLHQILGLRRLGVDPAKLLSMKKDDSSLTKREATAVLFARKLTETPAAVTDDDFAKVRAEFGEQGALEVVLQIGSFAFMNRFTDNLGLPSEDEAVKNYQDIYGEGSFKQNWKF